MRRRSVVDAGPLVALFNGRDRDHAVVVDFFRAYRGQLISTLAVVTEVMYVLDFSRLAQQDFLAWVFGGAIKLENLNERDGVRLIQLHAKYADRPMDFADATLVTIAERLGIREVLTLDGDFRTYRFRSKDSFLLPLLDSHED